MTFVEAMGILIGAALLLLGLCALVIRLEKKFPSKRYDERQKEVQGRAYKWTSVVGFLYFTTMLFLDFLFPSGLPMDLSFVIFIGMALQALVYALYCSLQGAYFPLRKSPKINIILLYIAGALNLINGANNVRWLGITLEKDYLELSGFEVEIENDGHSGLKRALEEDFDLFILDLMLPEVDGFEIC